MIKANDVENFINEKNYDLRESKNGRWIDQKCTPDVISIVSDCVIQYSNKEVFQGTFTSKDIWQSEYAEEMVEDIFSKPNTKEKKSENEYDKFFAQPLEMLVNAGILSKERLGRSNLYKIVEKDILEYISVREKNALDFLIPYIKKVMKDSGIWQLFIEFFEEQNNNSYYKLKESYEQLIIKNTNINKILEPRRIFTKVLNPLAYKYKKLGSARGRLSKRKITFSSLMYNKVNFRDLLVDKPKDMTRSEWEKENEIKVNVNYYKYQSNKAKRFLKQYNDELRGSLSEINDEYSNGKATQVHHIFPQSEYPEISSYLENLICLTPTQHYYKAHPNNNTQIIDKEYQGMLLKAKSLIIKEDIEKCGDDSIYNFPQYVEVINEGLSLNIDANEASYSYVMNCISKEYDHL